MEKKRKTAQRNSRLESFHGELHDMFMLDRDQDAKFKALCGQRGPFRDVSQFPWLDEALARHSAGVLEREGKAFWRDAGGEFRSDGQPYCKLTSLLATSAVQLLAGNPGGLLWRDRDGVAWAVRLARVPQWSKDKLYGFCINWADSVAAVSGDEDPGPEGLPFLTSRERRRSLAGLQQIGGGIRLSPRAEQILWAIHTAVLQQRRSLVTLPDVYLGQIVWGGQRDKWPRNWRRDLVQTLRSLMSLRSEIIVLGKHGWNPRFGAGAVAVAGVVDLAEMCPDLDRCDADCPIGAAGGVAHSHFRVQIGCGFLGVLEQFMTEDDGEGGRTYDFFGGKSAAKETEILQRARQQGRIVTASTLSKIFGAAAWSELPKSQRNILDALLHEVTRQTGSKRTDKARVLGGNHVVNAKADGVIECPYLQPDQSYVTFGGNGKRAGCGYRIVGQNGRGWLHKCGWEIPADDNGAGRVARAFLANLQRLADTLGLSVVGLGKGGTWFNLKMLLAMAGSKTGMQRLLMVNLRIYAPVDYLVRLRNYFAEKGHFSQIADAKAADTSAQTSLRSFTLADRVRHAGIRHDGLAGQLGISRSHATNLLNGRKTWSKKLRRRCERLLQKLETDGSREQLGC